MKKYLGGFDPQKPLLKYSPEYNCKVFEYIDHGMGDIWVLLSWCFFNRSSVNAVYFKSYPKVCDTGCTIVSYVNSNAFQRTTGNSQRRIISTVGKIIKFEHKYLHFYSFYINKLMIPTKFILHIYCVLRLLSLHPVLRHI